MYLVPLPDARKPGSGDLAHERALAGVVLGDGLPVERLWGVDKQESKVFQRRAPLATEPRDRRPVVSEREVKSVSNLPTFERSIVDIDVRGQGGGPR